jgi:diaminopimelate decarboxylase
MSLITPLSYFPEQQGQRYAEGVALSAIAQQFGTPTYVYSKAALVAAYQAYASALAGKRATIHYAMKTNSNLSILRLFGELGAGFDIVSGGELQRVIAAGCSTNKVVFSGVGKTADEMRLALQHGIKCFNLESVPELDRLNAVAASMGKVAPISVRVNPDVDAKTHPYISTGLKENKFGVAFEDALPLYRKAAALPNIQVIGIDCHIGSQLTEISPYLDALDKVLDLVAALRAEHIVLHHLDLGGGLGIRYQDETPPAASELIGAILQRLEARGFGDLELAFEPGRSLVGNAGILLTKVEYLKHNSAKNFAVVDAAMNDLMRPAMYEAFHDMVAVQPRNGGSSGSAGNPQSYDIVGPVCESGDWLGRNREFDLAEGDLIAILSAGAYGMTMASNYNTRGRAAEVLVDGEQVTLIRRRETVEDLLRAEQEI